MPHATSAPGASAARKTRVHLGHGALRRAGLANREARLAEVRFGEAVYFAVLDRYAIIDRTKGELVSWLASDKVSSRPVPSST